MSHATRTTALALTALLAASCAAYAGSPTGDDPSGKADGRTRPSVPIDELSFEFGDTRPEDYTVQTDSLGVSLLATVLRNRSDSYNCRGVNNQLELLSMYEGLVRLHQMWGDDIERAGYPTCRITHPSIDDPSEVDIVDFLSAVPCTTQRVTRRFEDGTVYEGPRVIDLITPDHATIDVDGPPGFPNGRHPSDQITDLILAMAFVDLDEEMTAERVHLNPPENDQPFPRGFPYLAPAHESVSGDPYYDDPSGDY